MKLHEYQSKAILARYGVPTPGGMVVTSPQDAYDTARELGGEVVIKAQALTKGRGKAGGIRLARSADQAREMTEAVLGLTIRGMSVHKVLVEPSAEIYQEFYLGIHNDRATEQPTITAATGAVGMSISASRHTGRLAREVIDPLLGLQEHQVRHLLVSLELPRHLWKPFSRIAHQLYQCFDENDATRAEIDPLALTRDGHFVALDGNLVIDDSALFRHPELADMRDLHAETPEEMRARALGLSYVPLDGEIGCLVNGAGLGMAVMDMTRAAAMRLGLPSVSLANFIDVGGGARADKVIAAMQIITSQPRVRALLFSIFGGITRCDEVAYGIVQAISTLHLHLPMVVRLAGTNAEQGRLLIDSANLPNLQNATSLTEAAEKVVRAAREVSL
ncbi:MAG: ADP-forming succinate--CoA ligase subunit beta [Chloroflexi bacterium CFX4]|nr:ADP-forming succinate--CoA ligase subunit beta [Chloroflexi bacterium CFX4]MDL1924473.1 ADP-forming succinate--CoA ligase subunit beta [Chloroflexi bacterium CFX3]